MTRLVPLTNKIERGGRELAALSNNFEERGHKLKKICGLLICSLCMLTIPTTLTAADRDFVKAIVVDNQEHTKVLPRRGKLTDAPPPSTEFDHDITVRVGCTQYVVRYRSELDYLPPALAPGQSIEVSPSKSVLYAKIPGNKDSRMSIIQSDQLKGDACSAGK